MESASFLLWAWPRLLGWQRPLNWLFSPVVGNKVYPGDIWGIDGNGDLLIVETKLDRSGRGQNPFADFVPCCQRSVEELWHANSLRAHWLHLADLEDVFLDEHARYLQTDSPLKGTYPGVLPYSRHRDAVWRWQSIFRRRVLPKFRRGSWRREVERSLQKREARKNPAPFFYRHYRYHRFERSDAICQRPHSA
jgi:hypothetical protein